MPADRQPPLCSKRRMPASPGLPREREFVFSLSVPLVCAGYDPTPKIPFCGSRPGYLSTTAAARVLASTDTRSDIFQNCMATREYQKAPLYPNGEASMN